MKEVISWVLQLSGLLIGGSSVFAYWGYRMKYPDQLPMEVELMFLGLGFSLMFIVIHQTMEREIREEADEL